MIFSFLFKKRIAKFNEIKNELYSEIRKEKIKNRILEKEKEDLDRRNERIKYLLNSRISKRSRPFIDRTKKGIDVLVAVNDKEIEIEIFDLDTKFYAENRSIVLWANSLFLDDKVLFIKDIQGGNGLGHGELALNYLFNIAKKKGFSKIEGRVSSVDFDHVERLKHFYKKMGFEGNFENLKNKDLLVKTL